MNPNGDIHATEAVKRELEREVGPHARKVKVKTPAGAGAVAIADQAIAAAGLAKMTRAARVVFWGSRKNGASEAVAFARARAREKMQRRG